MRVAVQSNKLPTVIINRLYRHPKSLNDIFDYTENVLDFIKFKNKTFFLLGDFDEDLLSNNNKLKQACCFKCKASFLDL